MTQVVFCTAFHQVEEYLEYSLAIFDISISFASKFCFRIKSSVFSSEFSLEIVSMILSFGSLGSSLSIFLLDLGSLPSSIKHLLAEAIFLGGVMYDGWDCAYAGVVDLSGRTSKEDLKPLDQCSEHMTPFSSLSKRNNL